MLLDENPDRTFILVYGDLDRFKVFNDLYGAEAGDRLLASVGSMIVDILRRDRRPLDCGPIISYRAYPQMHSMRIGSWPRSINGSAPIRLILRSSFAWGST